MPHDDLGAVLSASTATAPRPLNGLRIIDVSNVLAGPLATYLLASLGAEVIKVERPQGGDLARKMGADPARGRAFMGTSYLATSAGKRSVTLNLQSPKGQEIFRRLVTKADAVFENFKPGTMQKLGLDYDALRLVKPDLVYCAISGFGQDGPLAMRPAYDQIIQGMSGLMSLTGTDGPTPSRAGFVVCDSFAGAVAALGAVSAIFRARATGVGAMVDVSMLESSMVMAAWIVSDFANAGRAPTRLGNDSRSAAPSGTFPTKDGHINIVCNEDRQFLALCDALALGEMKQSPVWTDRQERFRRRDEMKAILHTVLAQKTSAEWDEILTRHGVPCGPILTIPEVLDLPHLHARGFQKPCAGSDVVVGGTGMRFAGEAEDAPPLPPELGHDNDGIYAELGYDAAALAALRAEHII
ncbi:CaiB/BaiF CoA transferase family protein [Humitalea sp. 24SJ18S-53]|uniref:CaiB/BaiF CoA transferase family protein n=1 Tax=Humitalea sp. 24SJ18S-53 TaxID=3422307 RepID=UPI003D676141